MVRAYLGIGGNLGHRKATLRSAVRRINKSTVVEQVSPLYETEPVGFRNQPSFLNAVVAVEAPEDPFLLLKHVNDIEADLGRQRSYRNAPRTIDIDVLLFGDTVLDDDSLTIPHPRMHERAFVLVPLADIAPDVVHPRLGRTVKQLADELWEAHRAEVQRIRGADWVDLGFNNHG